MGVRGKFIGHNHLASLLELHRSLLAHVLRQEPTPLQVELFNPLHYLFAVPIYFLRDQVDVELT